MQSRRAVLRSSAGLVATLGASNCLPVLAQQSVYPSRPIRLIIPSSAGSGADIIARRITTPLQEILGQPVYIDNIAGVGGVLGAEALASSTKDGHTIGVVSNSLFVAPFVYKKLRIDVNKDLVPVAMVATGPLLLVARIDFPASNVRELRAEALKYPGKVTYASTGSGSILRLMAEQLQHLGNFRLLHVPYKGLNQVVPDILSGIVDVAFLPYPSVSGFIKQGRAKVLGTSGASRLGVLADVAPIKDTIPAFEFGAWNSIAAPAGVAAPIVEKLNVAFASVLSSQDVIAYLNGEGTEPLSMSPSEMRKFFEAESDKFAKIVKTVGVTEE